MNTPRGDAFITDGAKGCTVVLQADGYKITRRRGPSVNEYLLGKSPYKAMGTDVPDRIAHILKLGDVNWQNQHEAPFWFAETPGQVSRNLNAIIDLDSIDKALAAVNAMHQRASIQSEIAEGKLKEAVAKKRELVWVKKAAEDFDKVYQLSDDYNNAADRVDDLETGLEDAKQAARTRGTAVRKLLDMDRLIRLGDMAGRQRADMLSLAATVKLAKLCKGKKAPDMSKLDKMIQLHKTLSAKIETLWNTIDGLEKDRVRMGVAMDDLKETEKEIKEGTEGICPLCGSELEDEG